MALGNSSTSFTARQSSHSQVDKFQTFQGLLTLFPKQFKDFSFSEIRGLSNAGLEFKAGAGLFQQQSTSTPRMDDKTHFSVHMLDADTLSISAVCRHICALYNAAELLLWSNLPITG